MTKMNDLRTSSVAVDILTMPCLEEEEQEEERQDPDYALWMSGPGHSASTCSSVWRT